MNYTKLKTPCYIIDTDILEDNLKKLAKIKKDTGCKILLATKAYSLYDTFPLIGKYLDGVTSSSLFEARLGFEEMGKEVHIFSPGYREDEFEEILKHSTHIVFNSFTQLEKYKNIIEGKSIGIRINPEFSTQDHPIYDPASRYSRLGVTQKEFKEEYLKYIEGIHFHTLCEQNSDALYDTLMEVERKFGKYFKSLKWLNFGGGHWITKEYYDLDRLYEAIRYIENKYPNLTVYLEPGEAVVLNSGVLVSRVLDIAYNEINNAILDTSATCHMPDVLEMPYRPIVKEENPNGKYSYRFGGPTCLAGDVIGDYRFDHELKMGDYVTFMDMAMYTMVKNNTFNGINLPSIYLKTGDELKMIKEFSYEDFKSRV